MEKTYDTIRYSWECRIKIGEINCEHLSCYGFHEEYQRYQEFVNGMSAKNFLFTATKIQKTRFYRCVDQCIKYEDEIEVERKKLARIVTMATEEQDNIKKLQEYKEYLEKYYCNNETLIKNMVKDYYEELEHEYILKYDL